VIRVLNSAAIPEAGHPVTCTAPSRGASLRFRITGTNFQTFPTNLLGIATSSTPIANGILGSYTVVCTGSGSVSFTMTNTAANAVEARPTTAG
jgi:hypothetical protein